MNPNCSDTRTTRLALLAAFLLLPCYAGPAFADTRPFAAKQAADPTGTVEIVNVSGSIEVSGWDQPLVDVSGTIGDKVERGDVTGSANHTTVRVVLPSGSSWSGDSSAHLKIKVPHASSLDVSLVSADLVLSAIDGSQKVQTVSGNVSGSAGGKLQINTVSGDVRLSTHDAHATQIKSISGDLNVSGADGDVALRVSRATCGSAALSHRRVSSKLHRSAATCMSGSARNPMPTSTCRASAARSATASARSPPKSTTGPAAASVSAAARAAGACTSIPRAAM